MDQERILGALRRVAVENGVSLETVMGEVDQIIDIGMNSSDPVVRRRWKTIPCQGARPTVVELVSYLSEQVRSISCK